MAIYEEGNRDIILEVEQPMDIWESENVSFNADLFVSSKKPFVTEGDIISHSGGLVSNTSIEAKYLEIYDDVEIDGDLKTNEGFTGEEDVHILGHLNVSGGDCLVGGNLTAKSITFNHEVEDSGLVVDGDILSHGPISVFGDLRCGGNLTATELTVTGNSTIIGITTAEKISIGKLAEFGGEINGELTSTNTEKISEEKVLRLTRNIMGYRAEDK